MAKNPIKKEDFDFLRELVEAPSASGYEQPAAETLRARMKKSATTVETNVMGSVHATLKGKKNDGLSVMLAGHIDEIGLMVNYITPEGYLTVRMIGGVDAAIMLGLRVKVHTSSGSILGVVGRKPFHLIEKAERENVTPMDKLFIDVGMPVEEVRKKVMIGDSCTFDVGLEEFGDGMAVSRAFDDKMGAWISARVLEEVKRAGGAPGDLIVAGTVQEEIGLRGGETSAFGLDPDIFIAVEVGHATDYPDIEKRAYGEAICGAGPLIARGPNINPKLFDLLVAAAKKAKVPYQIGPEPGGTGTDANPAQLQHGGKVAGLLSIPLRYMHTPTEVLSTKDLDYAVKMLTQFVLDLKPKTNFIP